VITGCRVKPEIRGWMMLNYDEYLQKLYSTPNVIALAELDMINAYKILGLERVSGSIVRICHNLGEIRVRVLRH
jgi:hypothetical protein